MNFKRSVTACTLALGLFSMTALAAGTSSGGGGIGILVDGKPRVFDLYENGVDKPFIDPHTQIKKDIQTVVEDGLRNLDSETRKNVTLKLSEISEVRPMMAGFIALGLSQYRWTPVDELNDTNDDNTVVKIPRKRRIQLAVRRDSVIRIDKHYWAQLSVEDRAVLVIHEMLYAFASPQDVNDTIGDHTTYQSSADARLLNAILFEGPIKNNLADLEFVESRVTKSFGDESFIQKTQNNDSIEIDTDNQVLVDTTIEQDKTVVLTQGYWQFEGASDQEMNQALKRDHFGKGDHVQTPESICKDIGEAHDHTEALKVYIEQSIFSVNFEQDSALLGAGSFLDYNYTNPDSVSIPFEDIMTSDSKIDSKKCLELVGQAFQKLGLSK